MFRRLLRALPARGPKKAKPKEEATGESTTDVINIFKDKSDPEVKPLSEYPAWLGELLQGYEHPVRIAERIQKGERVMLSAREQRRLVRWTRKVTIMAKNIAKPPEMRFTPKLHDRIVTLGDPTVEDSDGDPEEHLGPYLRLALGAPYQEELDAQMERLKVNLESHKK